MLYLHQNFTNCLFRFNAVKLHVLPRPLPIQLHSGGFSTHTNWGTVPLSGARIALGIAGIPYISAHLQTQRM